MEVTSRVCNVCGIEKPVIDLVKSARYIGGYMPTCKVCRNAYWKARRENNPQARQQHIDAVLRSKMLRKHGLTNTNYARIVEEQGDRCKLCGTTEKGRSDRFRTWNIDHDHKTGAVRGLLCHRCNIALGYYESLVDEIGVERVAEYLGGIVVAGGKLREYVKADPGCDTCHGTGWKDQRQRSLLPIPCPDCGPMAA